MTRSPEACSASTRWCPTMPLAPAIATVRDSSALGLVVIVSSFQILCVRNALTGLPDCRPSLTRHVEIFENLPRLAFFLFHGHFPPHSRGVGRLFFVNDNH